MTLAAPKSLRLRLLAAGFVALVAALGAAGVGLTLIFERHVERRAVAEAQNSLRTLIAGARFDGAKLVLATQPPDPRFDEAYSGLYWQVQDAGAPLARSRSLWDVDLSLPQDALTPNAAHVHALTGPRGAALLAVEQDVVLSTPQGERRLRLVVAQNRDELTRARDDFARDLALGLALLAAALLGASVVQVGIGLKPLLDVRVRLSATRSGLRARLPLDFPREVLPLVTEINTLLDDRDAALARARGRAADLAHGLKTPLTALAAHMRALRARGETATADAVDALAAMMRRHVERELARARAGGGTANPAHTPVRLVAEEIAAAAIRTPQAEGKQFDFDIDPDLALPIDRADLEELLGNLVENAVRHARQTVTIRAVADPASLEVSDDGAGLDEETARRLVTRGQRLDQGEGAGLGLAIVADLAEAYGATLSLGRAAQGGLRVRVIFRPSGDA